MSITEFLLARITEDEAEPWELLPYECPPGCCAPAGFVGHRCTLCGDESFGGTIEAITEICIEHAEQVHRRSRMLAECEAKRRIVERCDIVPAHASWEHESLIEDVLAHLASVYADHPDYREEWRP